MRPFFYLQNAYMRPFKFSDVLGNFSANSFLENLKIQLSQYTSAFRKVYWVLGYMWSRAVIAFCFVQGFRTSPDPSPAHVARRTPEPAPPRHPINVASNNDSVCPPDYVPNRVSKNQNMYLYIHAEIKNRYSFVEAFANSPSSPTFDCY